MEESKKRRVEDAGPEAAQGGDKLDDATDLNKIIDAHKELEKLGHYIYDMCLDSSFDGNDDFIDGLPEGVAMEKGVPIFTVNGKKYRLALVVDGVKEELEKVHVFDY